MRQSAISLTWCRQCRGRGGGGERGGHSGTQLTAARCPSCSTLSAAFGVVQTRLHPPATTTTPAARCQSGGEVSTHRPRLWRQLATEVEVVGDGSNAAAHNLTCTGLRQHWLRASRWRPAAVQLACTIPCTAAHCLSLQATTSTHLLSPSFRREKETGDDIISQRALWPSQIRVGSVQILDRAFNSTLKQAQTRRGHRAHPLNVTTECRISKFGHRGELEAGKDGNMRGTFIVQKNTRSEARRLTTDSVW